MDNTLSQTPAPQVPPQPMQPQPPHNERSMAQKMLWPLVSLVLIAAIAIGFAYWWNNRATGPAVVVNNDPKEAVIQGIERLVAAKDGAFELTAAKQTFEAMNDKPLEPMFGTSTPASSLRTTVDALQSDMKIRMTGIFAMTGVTSTQSSFDLDIAGSEFSLQMMARVFDEDIFLQLAKFKMQEELPVNLTPVLGTWISINVRQALNDFGAGLGAAAGGNENILKMIEEQPTRFIVSDSAVYAKIVGDVLRRHDVSVYSKVSENTYRIDEREGSTEAQTEAFVRDIIQSMVQQYFRDVDAAIAATTKAGDAKGAEQLRSYRADLVTEVGENGAKGADEVIKSMEDEADDATPLAAKPQVEEGKTKVEFLVQIDQRTGTVESFMIQPVTSYMGKDLRAMQPAKLTFSKLNSGIRVERPAQSKSIYEMLPVFMGMMAGADAQMDVKE